MSICCIKRTQTRPALAPLNSNPLSLHGVLHAEQESLAYHNERGSTLLSFLFSTKNINILMCNWESLKLKFLL